MLLVTMLCSRSWEFIYLAWLELCTLWPSPPYFPFCHPLANSILLSASMIWPFLDSTSEIIEYLSSCVWLVSLNFHVVTDGRISFFLWPSSISTVYMYHKLFIHLSTSGHSGCFCIFIVNTAINTEVHISFGINVLVFSG